MEYKIEPKMRVDIYSHFFKVTKFDHRIRSEIMRFCSRYVHRGIQVSKTTAGKMTVFAIKTEEPCEFRFHLFQLKDFLFFFRNMYIGEDLIDIVRHKLYEPAIVDVAMKDHIVLRDDQEQAVQFMLSEPTADFDSKLITLKPGAGKTISGMAAACRVKKRTAVLVLPEFEDKWKSDIPTITKSPAKDLMLVNTTGRLKGLIQMAKDGEFDSPFLLITLTTLRSFYDSYEEGPDSEKFLSYGCEPEYLWELLGVGTILMDESHKHLHLIYRTLLHIHVPLHIALTATMISDDSFIAKIQSSMFPMNMRFKDPVVNKYVNMFGVTYEISDEAFRLIKTTQPGTGSYSHNAYEKSILKVPFLRDKYLKIIGGGVHSYYINEYIPGDKLALYFASIKMCTLVTEYLRNNFPGKTVERYVEDDPYENVINPDIRVTTIGSGGTGIDIPGLRTVILTVSINSSASNIQVFGRLRELKDRSTKFISLYAPRIKKQRAYYEKRRTTLRDRVKTLQEHRSNYDLI